MTSTPLVVRNDWSGVPVPPLGAWRPTERVSVVIPAYQCQASLDLTLAALADQTYPADLLEVVVVDDGSEPPLELPRRRPATTRLVRVSDHSTGTGIANACNVGMRQATGDILLRLDADMVVYPEHVEAHARWHHALPYAVTLGTKLFVDVQPGGPGWPTPERLAEVGARQLFDPRDGRPHAYPDAIIDRTDLLRDADHLGFLTHVGATVALRRELFEAAGGYDPGLRRGSDTEFGYRLAQAGAVFIPERAAGSWHLGLSGMQRDGHALRRLSAPFLADRMPHPRWLRKVGGSAWSVPLVVVAMDVADHPLELVRAAADAVLRGEERDLRLDLVGPWSKVEDEPRTIRDDPLLDLRLLAATYRADPQVRLVEQAPVTAFPAPYLLHVPATAGLSAHSLSRLIDEADRHRAGAVRVPLRRPADDRSTVTLWRTAAMSRARWHPDRSPAEVVAQSYGVRELTPAAAGIIDLSTVPLPTLAASGADVVAGVRPGSWLPATVEVAGLRSWLRATRLVVALTAIRVVSRLRRAFGPSRRRMR